MSGTPTLSPPGFTEDPDAKQEAAFQQIQRKDIYDKMGVSRLATSVKDVKQSIESALNMIDAIGEALALNETCMSEATKSKLKLNKTNQELELALRKIQLMETQLDELQTSRGRSARMEPTGETISTVLPGVKGKGRKRITHKRGSRTKWTSSGTRRRN